MQKPDGAGCLQISLSLLPLHIHEPTHEIPGERRSTHSSHTPVRLSRYTAPRGEIHSVHVVKYCDFSHPHMYIGIHIYISSPSQSFLWLIKEADNYLVTASFSSLREKEKRKKVFWGFCTNPWRLSTLEKQRVVSGFLTRLSSSALHFI